VSVFKYKVKIHAGKQRNREIQQNFKKYKYTSEFLCVDYMRDLPIYIHRQIDRHRQTDRQTYRQTDTQTYRQTDRHTDRQTDEQTDGQ